ncbi:Alpha/Beta hydrolase protein [Mycena filopes]|nr:Alpha/Beta hydrolase protein [Mycena filopes]
MASTLLVVLFSSLAVASAASSTRGASDYSCKDYTIPVKNVVALAFPLSFHINTEFDINDWTINESRRDSATAFNGIAGPPTNMTNSFNISARFCKPNKATKKTEKVLVMTHGLGADKRYWDPTFAGAAQYSLTQAAIARGYSVFTYDRLGTGLSTKADPHNVVQFPVQVEILAALTRAVLAPNSAYTMGQKLTSAFHFGHSYGAYLTAGIASVYPELTSGISLSAYSGLFDWFDIFIAGWQSRIAAQLDPSLWGHLASGYLTAVDPWADAYVNFKTPFFDHPVSAWVSSVKSPYAIGELASLGQLPYDTSNFTKPVQVMPGRYDVSACGGNCDGVLNRTAAFWPKASPLNLNATFEAGHMLNLHHNSGQAFAAMLDFVDNTA